MSIVIVTDLGTQDVLLRPNVWQHIQLTAGNQRIQYKRDGKLIFDFADAEPYTRGYFGFHTTFKPREAARISNRQFKRWTTELKRSRFQRPARARALFDSVGSGLFLSFLRLGGG